MSEQISSGEGPAVVEGGAPQAALEPGQGVSLSRMNTRVRELEGRLSEAQKAVQRERSKAKAGYAQWHVESDADSEEDGWLMSFLDTLTQLLILLVVLLTFAGKGSSAATKMVESAHDGVLPATDGLLPGKALEVPSPLPKKPAEDPLQGLPLDKLGKDIEVVVNESTVSFRISSEILFSSGQADLSLAGLGVLQQLVPVLNSTPHRIAVEGHTDAVPVRNGRYPSNWELSGARAGSVVRYLESNGVASNRLRAVGYADTRPLADNGTAEGRARNRRVELIMEKPDKP